MCMDITSCLKIIGANLGADLIGVADLEPLRKGRPLLPGNLIESYFYGLSIGIHLQEDVIETIEDRPIPEYARHYRKINATLDTISAQIVRWIWEKGVQGRAVPASQIMDETNLLGRISHTAVARVAGLGWQGK